MKQTAGLALTAFFFLMSIENPIWGYLFVTGLISVLMNITQIREEVQVLVITVLMIITMVNTGGMLLLPIVGSTFLIYWSIYYKE